MKYLIGKLYRAVGDSDPMTCPDEMREDTIGMLLSVVEYETASKLSKLQWVDLEFLVGDEIRKLTEPQHWVESWLEGPL